VPLAERGSQGARERGLVQIEARAHSFQQLNATLGKQLQLASPGKLALLASTNARMAELAGEELFGPRSRRPQSSADF